MVVLSAAILTKNGKTLVARQYVEMTRSRIEGLLSSFNKLLGSDTNTASKQHTYLETETIRYVYLTLEHLYLVLITNRNSNIVDDLEGLKLLSKEDKICEKNFEIIHAIDELFTFGGYREALTLQQLRTNLEMESHEEKLHNMIKLSKMETAKDAARDAARVIKEKQRQEGMNKLAGLGSSSSNLSYGSSDSSAYGSGGSSTPTLGVSSPYGDTSSSSSSSSLGLPKSTAKAAPVKGMSLGGGKGKSLEEALVKEDKLAPVSTRKADAAAGASASSSAAVAPAAPQITHPVMLVVGEKIVCKLTREGSVSVCEVKGALTLTAASDEAALCSVQMRLGANVEHFTFSTHPKVNKAKYDKDGLIQLKDTTKGFPANRPVGILKWTYTSNSDDVLVPFKVNCWPEEESRGLMNVSIEYTMDQPRLELHDVCVRIPLGTRDGPSIINCDGDYKHLPQQEELQWTIPLIDRSNASGALEFTVPQRNSDAFFPINVSFHSNILLCDVDVASVKSAEGDTPILYGSTKSLSTEEYTVE